MSSACSCPSAFVAACEIRETTSFLFAMNWLNVFCTFGLSHAELPTCAFLTFCRALPRAFPNDSCLSQHVQVRKEVPARRSGPKAKQVSWTRSQNQSTNTQKHTKTNNMSMSMINHLQNKLKRVWLPACLCPAVGSILRTCDKPLCRESRQYTKRDFLRKYLQPVSTGTRQSNRWRELLRGPSFITFQLWPLAPIRRPEDAASRSPKQFHYTSYIVMFHWASQNKDARIGAKMVCHESCWYEGWCERKRVLLILWFM